MRELEHIPSGLLGQEFDELARERATLADRFSDTWRTLETAEQSMPDAKQKDREAIAEAVREGRKRPGHEHTKNAQLAIDQAKEELLAIKHAVEANETDTLVWLDERRDDLSVTLAKHLSERRGEALDLLNRLSEMLLDFGGISSLASWCESPRTPASGQLRPYTGARFRVDPRSVHQLTSRGEGVPAGALLDLIGERLEGAAYLDSDLMEQARAAGLAGLTNIERCNTGAATLNGRVEPGKPQHTLLNIARVGLVKIVLNKRDVSVSLLVGRKALDDSDLLSILRLNREPIERAFAAGNRVVVSVDAATQALHQELRPDKSKGKATERQERVAESQRFQAEQAKLREQEAEARAQQPVTA